MLAAAVQLLLLFLILSLSLQAKINLRKPKPNPLLDGRIDQTKMTESMSILRERPPK